MEGAVSWVALVAGLNFILNSLTLILVIASNIRQSSAYYDAAYRSAREEGHRDARN